MKTAQIIPNTIFLIANANAGAYVGHTSEEHIVLPFPVVFDDAADAFNYRNQPRAARHNQSHIYGVGGRKQQHTETRTQKIRTFIVKLECVQCIIHKYTLYANTAAHFAHTNGTTNV